MYGSLEGIENFLTKPVNKLTTMFAVKKCDNMYKLGSI